MTDTTKLDSMLDNLIDKNEEQAQVDFHEYLRGKMADILGGQQAADDSDKE